MPECKECGNETDLAWTATSKTTGRPAIIYVCEMCSFAWRNLSQQALVAACKSLHENMRQAADELGTSLPLPWDELDASDRALLVGAVGGMLSSGELSIPSASRPRSRRTVETVDVEIDGGRLVEMIDRLSISSLELAAVVGVWVSEVYHWQSAAKPLATPAAARVLAALYTVVDSYNDSEALRLGLKLGSFVADGEPLAALEHVLTLYRMLPAPPQTDAEVQPSRPS